VGRSEECLQNAAVHAFGNKGKQKSDWFDENVVQISALIKDQNRDKKDIQRPVRQIKNDWFTNKANQAKMFYNQKNLSSIPRCVKCMALDPKALIRSVRKMALFYQLTKRSKIDGLNTFQIF